MSGRPLFSGLFWADTLERAIKTLAQALVGSQALDALIAGSFLWTDKLLAAAAAAGVSVLTSIASAPIGSTGTASVVVDAEHHTAPQPLPDVDHPESGHADLSLVLLGVILLVVVLILADRLQR